MSRLGVLRWSRIAGPDGLRLVPGTPHAPPSDPAGWLPARVAELEADNALLRQAAADRDERAAAQLAARDAQIQALAARVEELERLLAKDSSTSSKPPSSDSPYKKKPKDRSLRGRSGRKPGGQPGAQSATLGQSADADHTVECGPAACGCCGHDLSGVPVTGMQKRQLFEAAPPPPPVVTEYQILARQCPACGETSVGLAPAGVTGRVQYGPRVHAGTALAVCANYLPVARAAKLVAALTGVSVSAGFTAGIRGKAAARLGPFMARVRDLLRSAGVLYADETPARAAGHLHYVHVACTEFLTAMHTGDRTKEAIDAGGVLPGYAGTIVRDGYKGYEHLTDALHAWCWAQYAEPGIMRNGAARVAGAACRGGARSDAGPGGVLHNRGWLTDASFRRHGAWERRSAMPSWTKVRVAGVLAPYARGFGRELRSCGFTDLSTAEQLRLMAHLSRWMTREGVDALSCEQIAAYCAARKADGYVARLTPGSLGRLLAFLQAQGVLPASPAAGPPPSAEEKLLGRYRAHLVEERGLVPAVVSR